MQVIMQLPKFKNEFRSIDLIYELRGEGVMN